MTQVFFATCAPGLEPLLHAEVRALGLKRSERQVGGVRFEGSMRDAWRANLWLRTAVRVLLRIGRFQARDGDELYQGAAAIQWERYLAPSGSLVVAAQSRESALDHSRFLEQRVKDAVVDRFRERTGERPSVSRDRPDLSIHVHVFRDRVTLSLDTSGDSLHRRGWRVHQGIAPLSETLAAAVVLSSGWNRRAPLLDPFCGSGTILIEAAMIAANVAPGSYRERFGFENWLDHDAPAFDALRLEARAQRTEPRKLRLVGSDRDPERVAEARANVASAGFESLIEVSEGDALRMTPRPGWNAWIVTNPPYGQRLGDAEQVTELMRGWGDVLRERCQGYHLTLFSGNPASIKALGLRGMERQKLKNGALDCELVNVDI